MIGEGSVCFLEVFTPFAIPLKVVGGDVACFKDENNDFTVSDG